MRDDITRAEIRKTAGDGVTGLPGAELELLDEGGQQITSWVSTEETHILEKLPVGTYILREIHAPSGYQKAEDMVIEVKDTSDIQKYVLKNEKLPKKKEHTKTRETDIPATKTEEVNAPLTGDTGRWILWCCTMILSAAAVGWIRKNKR